MRCELGVNGGYSVIRGAANRFNGEKRTSKMTQQVKAA